MEALAATETTCAAGEGRPVVDPALQTTVAAVREETALRSRGWPGYLLRGLLPGGQG